MHFNPLLSIENEKILVYFVTEHPYFISMGGKGYT
jgi:hypothetical protein